MFSDGGQGKSSRKAKVVIEPAICGKASVHLQNRIEDARVGVLSGQLAFDVRVESQGTGTAESGSACALASFESSHGTT